MFNSYVSLPEGISIHLYIEVYIFRGLDVHQWTCLPIHISMIYRYVYIIIFIYIYGGFLK